MGFALFPWLISSDLAFLLFPTPHFRVFAQRLCLSGSHTSGLSPSYFRFNARRGRNWNWVSYSLWFCDNYLFLFNHGQEKWVCGAPERGLQGNYFFYYVSPKSPFGVSYGTLKSRIANGATFQFLPVRVFGLFNSHSFVWWPRIWCNF